MWKTVNDFLVIKNAGKKTAEEIVQVRNEFLMANGYMPSPTTYAESLNKYFWQANAVRWPTSHVGKPSISESRAKKAFYGMSRRMQREVLEYFPDYDELVAILNKPEQEWQIEMQKRWPNIHD